MPGPLVSAIMITGKDPARIPFAVAAVKSFARQTYEHKELVIVNDGESLLPHIRDLRKGLIVFETQAGVGKKLTLGELRNIGMEKAIGRYIAQWDDDDWSHETRIEVQLKAAIEHGCPVTFRNQVRYSFNTGNSFVCHQVSRPGYAMGIPGTVLHPKTTLRYPAERKHEDTHFLKQFEKVHIIENPPELYLRFSHSANTWNERHLMQAYSRGTGRSNLPPAAKGYLRVVLKEHYNWQTSSSRGR